MLTLAPSVSSRKWVLLVKKVKVIIWMTGQCSVTGPTGWGMMRCGSSILPPRSCCLSLENNMAGPSAGRKRCMAWLSQARTTTGKPWKASSWNPVSCWRQKPTTRSSEPGGCEPLSPHSVHRHLLLPHPGTLPQVSRHWPCHHWDEDGRQKIVTVFGGFSLLQLKWLFSQTWICSFLSTRLVGEGAGVFNSYW